MIIILGLYVEMATSIGTAIQVRGASVGAWQVAHGFDAGNRFANRGGVPVKVSTWVKEAAAQISTSREYLVSG